MRDVTAAIEGISALPGEPWETSIPIIKVGISFTIGKLRVYSTANNELVPPSW